MGAGIFVLLLNILLERVFHWQRRNASNSLLCCILAISRYENKGLRPSRGTQDLHVMLHFGGDMPRKAKAHRVPMVHLEPAEVLAVLKAAKTRGNREWCMVLFGYKHGLRASEVTALTLDDVDLKNGCIKIARLKGSLPTTQALSDHKGEPLLSEFKALRQWLKERPDDGSDYLFTSQKGGRLDRSQFFLLFQSIAADAGLAPEKQHPHCLKHSIATHLVSANVNLALVKQQLGHKAIGSTMRYISTSDKQASAATTAALMKLF
jgi:site-specific recombinase XerD